MSKNVVLQEVVFYNNIINYQRIYIWQIYGLEIAGFSFQFIKLDIS